MLVAGDFNSIPGSPAHCLLVNGKIDASMMVSTLLLGWQGSSRWFLATQGGAKRRDWGV